MKIFTFVANLCFFGASALVCCAADLNLGQSGTIFLPGVTADGGWVSVKKNNVLKNGGRDDSEMCSAAAAASAMTWWLNSKENANLADAEIRKIYESMCDAAGWRSTFADKSWDTYCHTVLGTKCEYIAANVGIYIDPRYPQVPVRDPSDTGDTDDSKDPNKDPDKKPDDSWISAPKPCEFVAEDIYTRMSLDEAVLRGIENGYGMALGVRRTDGGGHTIAIWGGEYTNYGDNFALTSLFYTDSDSDGGLVSTTKLYGSPDDAIEGRTVYYLETGGQKWKIERLDYLFHVRDADFSVPEPSAFGLLAGAGVLALTALRRRRRKSA